MQPQPPTALHICELCMDLQALLQPRGNITGIQVFTPYTTRDGIHNACLGFDASYIHLKTILSQALTISLTLHTVLMPTPSRLEQQSVQCRIYYTCIMDFYQKVGSGCMALCLNRKRKGIFTRVQTIRDPSKQSQHFS